jgi:hypothetical protein
MGKHHNRTHRNCQPSLGNFLSEDQIERPNRGESGDHETQSYEKSVRTAAVFGKCLFIHGRDHTSKL